MGKVGFIGAGNIATAIIKGAISSGYITPENIYIYDVIPKKADILSKCGVNAAISAEELAQICDFIFLTVKPQIYAEVLRRIAPCLSNAKTIVSVGAGITTDYVKSVAPSAEKVIRVMPNTPLMYGYGAVALVHKPPVTDDEFAYIKGFFDASGVTCVLSESLMDAVTGVSGSSPAFVFRFAREMIRSAVAAGIDQDSAEKLVFATIRGSAVMLEKSGLSPDELIKMVTSPNGTTLAGLNSMDATGFDTSVRGAVQAAVDRSAEISRTLGATVTSDS